MKKISKLGISVFFLSCMILFQGCLKAETDNPTAKEGEVKTLKKNCQIQYDKVLGENQVTFDDCNFAVRSSTFEKKEVEKPINNTILIFDVSGSMAGQVDGRIKLDIAKEAVAKFVDSLENSDVNLGVIAYGHKGSNSARDKNISCKGIEEIYYLGEVNASVIKNKINSFQPTGWTPIGSSFQKAEKILAKYAGEGYHNSIVLVSDGKETCGGNPVAAVEKLKNSGLNVVANVIGFDVGGEDERQLQEIAQNGGGEYFSVKNAGDFEYAFKRHQAFMEEFDHKMGNISMQLEDVVTFGDKYFECFMRLKGEEARVMLSIYADEAVDKKCSQPVEDKYYSERYNKIEAEMRSRFDSTMKLWKDASAFKK